MAAPSADPYARARADARNLVGHTGVEKHDIAVVLGSGWSEVADKLGSIEYEIDTRDLYGFADPTAPGHSRRVLSVGVGNKRILVLVGRVHLYEGYAVHQTVHGVRVAALSGCEQIILTNAAGSMRPEWPVGQAVLINDHLNFTGFSPLAGPPPPEPYPGRFLDLTHAWSPELRDKARAAVHTDLPEGVYAAVSGPHFETPAEIRMLKSMGADLVGMSTVLEAIAARHLGVDILGLSMITNPAAGMSDKTISADDVMAAAEEVSDEIAVILRDVVNALAED